jgi:peptidyl-prolyl cis-trans isomerase SurA
MIRPLNVSVTLAVVFACLSAFGTGSHAQPAPKMVQSLTRAPGKQITIDRIVAVVNDEVITQQDLNERVDIVTRQLTKQGVQLPGQDVLKTQVLERMINDQVQLGLAKENGVKVDDATVERAVIRLAEDGNTSVTAFRAQVESDGITFTRFREDLRNEITLSRLREREIESTIVVTDAEVEAQMALDSKDLAGEREFSLQHVLVVVPQNATPDQIEQRRRRALQALAEIRKGENFAKVAASFSDAPDGLSGGNLGWRPASRLPQLFADAIGVLKPGETSDIIRSPNGFHIIKLLDGRGRNAETTKINQTKTRHILIKLKETLAETEAKERLTRLRERIVGGADFGELAKVHSEDGSASKGGDLGWLAAGETVPEFERVINSLRDGEISQPFQSQFGWHIAQVISRRSEELSDDRRRTQARQTVRARKSDDVYQDWLRGARDRAYVDVRTEDKG